MAPLACRRAAQHWRERLLRGAVAAWGIAAARSLRKWERLATALAFHRRRCATFDQPLGGKP